MSRHEGVSCDSCLKGNFRGRRYKCLICYDYDLCGTCYESGATTARHTTDHPMQCILTRTDFDLYYGGEALGADQPQSFTCPYCSRMGLTELVLLDHVTAEHADAAAEVVCPICAALPSGDPNYVTDDFTAHLTLEHRAPRELEPMGGIRHVRRIPHPGRGVGGPRTRRSNMHFQSSASNALSGLAPNSRETMDPIAELLSQLSSVRSRAAAAQSVSSQLQQLEMQLQSTRYRQQLERLPRRQGEPSRSVVNGNQAPSAMLDFAAAVAGGSNNNNNTPSNTTTSSSNSQFLLSRYSDTDLLESDRQVLEVERADRSAFVQELLLSSLTENLRLDSDDDDLDVIAGPVAAAPVVASEDSGRHGNGSRGSSERLVSDPVLSSGLHNGRSDDVILRNAPQNELTHGLHGNVDSHGRPGGGADITKPVDRGLVSQPPVGRVSPTLGRVSPTLGRASPPIRRGSPPPQNTH